jgi:Zn-finger nucleic acid-binding protein
MKCPACANQLVQITVHDVTLDVCKGACGGIWFDSFELKKFDEPHEEAGGLLDIERDPDLVVDKTQRYRCPKCADMVMARHFFTVKHKIEVDECPGCAGLWLDGGELEMIRSQFESEAARDQAWQEEFTRSFGAELAAMDAEHQHQMEKAQRLAHALRFVCPSYYIPGKQAWGAF